MFVVKARGHGLATSALIVRTDDEADPTAKYFDLIVDAKWNVATCLTSGQGLDASALFGKECRRVTRYRFREDGYQFSPRTWMNARRCRIRPLHSGLAEDRNSMRTFELIAEEATLRLEGEPLLTSAPIPAGITALTCEASPFM